MNRGGNRRFASWRRERGNDGVEDAPAITYHEHELNDRSRGTWGRGKVDGRIARTIRIQVYVPNSPT